MFSRPVKSGWKPAPSSRSEPTEPPTSSRPSVGEKMPAISRRSVVLPEPLRPMNPIDAPGSTSKDTFFSAQISSVRRVSGRRIASFSVRFLCGLTRKRRETPSATI